MHIESVRLNNFRNFEDERLNLCERFNLFIGKNAQGKTNIIEAIFILSAGRSFRSFEFKDLMRWDSSEAYVRAVAVAGYGASELQVRIDDGRKSFFKNGKKVGSGSADLAAVLFSPEDVALLRDSPAARRAYIDDVVAKVVPSYRSLALRYGRALGHRNRILKESGPGVASLGLALSAWDEQIAGLGAKISIARAQWCTRLTAFLPIKYSAVAPEDGQALFRYRPNCGEDALDCGEEALARAIARALEERRGEEAARGFTLSGPHRDDFEACIGGAPAKRFGSQGQHRTFVLALKMAEMELLREVLGEAPIFLLDDAASELDRGRNEFLFDYLRSLPGQVFITATDADSIRIEGGAPAKRFAIAGGRAQEMA